MTRTFLLSGRWHLRDMSNGYSDGSAPEPTVARERSCEITYGCRSRARFRAMK